MTDRDARNEILARRARFVAAALASASIAGGCAPKEQVCLSPPQACLSVQPLDEDAGPQPCLEPPPPPDDDPNPDGQPLEPEKKRGPFAEPPPD